jgi:hypothetical protein
MIEFMRGTWTPVSTVVMAVSARMASNWVGYVVFVRHGDEHLRDVLRPRGGERQVSQVRN